MSTVSSSNADITVRYQRLAAEFAKLRSQFTVLKNGVIEEKAKNAQIQEELSVKDTLSRKLKVENESLSFRNEQLARRVENLQSELENLSRSGKKDKSKSKKDKTAEKSDAQVRVLQEELVAKLRENEHLHLKIAEMEALHVKEMQELSEKLRSDLEEEQRKHVTRRNTEEANPSQQPSREEENHKMESRQTTPEASEVTVVEIAATARATAGAVVNLMTLLEQRSCLHPFDSSMETIPRQIQMLCRDLTRASALASDVVAVLDELLEKENIDWIEDGERLTQALAKFTKHSTLVLPELLTRLCEEENKVPWCEATLERANVEWRESLVGLLAGLAALASTLKTLQHEAVLSALLDLTTKAQRCSDVFAARWEMESRLPVLSPRLACVNQTLKDCLAQLKKDTLRLSQKARAAFAGKLVQHLRPESPDLQRCSPTDSRNSLVCEIEEPRKEEQPSLHENHIQEDEAKENRLEILADTAELKRLRDRVTALESERERQSVELQLLRRKLANATNCEEQRRNDGEAEDVHVVQEHFLARLAARNDDVEREKARADFFSSESEVMVRRVQLIEAERDDLKTKITQLTRSLETTNEDLASTRRGYESQLAELSDHLAEMNSRPDFQNGNDLAHNNQRVSSSFARKLRFK